MIKIDKTNVYGFEAAVRGMRNPMNSWDRSDSIQCTGMFTGDCRRVIEKLDDPVGCTNGNYEFCIGKNDLSLMQGLAAAGTDHSKFLRMINVTCDIEAPLYWWKEFDTYKVGTVRNSCSTMHKIHSKEFTLEDFSTEHLNKSSLMWFKGLLHELNNNRMKFIDTGDKQYWWNLIQLLPSSYNQLATVQLNYQVIANMYHSRKNHKLDEWHVFCRWAEKLPYFMEIMGI